MKSSLLITFPFLFILPIFYIIIYSYIIFYKTSTIDISGVKDKSKYPPKIFKRGFEGFDLLIKIRDSNSSTISFVFTSLSTTTFSKVSLISL